MFGAGVNVFDRNCGNLGHIPVLGQLVSICHNSSGPEYLKTKDADYIYLSDTLEKGLFRVKNDSVCIVLASRNFLQDDYIQLLTSEGIGWLHAFNVWF